MSYKNWLVPVVLGLAWGSGPVVAQDLLQGDARSACEALLCLSTGAPPAACTPALQRYFSIQHRKFGRTQRLRSAFLRQCPLAYQTSPMAALATAPALASPSVASGDPTPPGPDTAVQSH